MLLTRSAVAETVISVGEDEDEDEAEFDDLDSSARFIDCCSAQERTFGWDVSLEEAPEHWGLERFIAGHSVPRLVTTADTEFELG